MCVCNHEFGDLPWLSVMSGAPWAAYAVSQSQYYGKAKAENVLKIKNSFDSTLDDPICNDDSENDNGLG